MYYLLLALYMAFACPGNTHSKKCKDTTVTTQGGIDGEGDGGDDNGGGGGGTGGEGGHVPPDHP